MTKRILAKDFGEVAVLMGGDSAEREVSLVSGKCALDALLRKGVHAYAIDVDKTVVDQLLARRPDRVFIALHGTKGEDGVIQGLLEVMDIPYASSDVASSSLTMHKLRSNLFWKGIGLPVIPTKVISKDDSLAALNKNFSFPVCVKPACSGSSCGISKVETVDEIPAAYAYAKKFSEEVMLEPWIEGREFSVGILGDEALPVIEITTSAGFYDYNAKYKNDNTGYLCPCDLDLSVQKKMQEIALAAFHTAGCRYWGRVDFLQDANGKIWLLEVNTIPGLTSHSLVPKAAEHVGINFDELIWKILAFTLR
ncbi:MAG: D-alanine--D-alanine ligase [Gammaproteobacteria bacterium]|nr:D-alanine--D-alanine ligase [Gammaproteobacteria bacterium]